MRAVTWTIAITCAACEQFAVVYELPDVSVVDATVDGAPFADAIVSETATPPEHDAAPPDVATTTTPCLDAGADAAPDPICRPPAAYCTDEYAVTYSPVLCSDASTCVFVPMVQDCLRPKCSSCTSDDAGNATCHCFGGGE